MSSPAWKVYDASGKYQAACKEAEAAAAVSMYGPGATVRHDHKTRVWTEGEDGVAADSYDHSAVEMHRRLREAHLARNARYAEGRAV